MTYRYRIAVRRCRTCHGKGTVKRPYDYERPLDNYFLGLLKVIQQPCRSCDGTGKEYQWERTRRTE